MMLESGVLKTPFFCLSLCKQLYDTTMDRLREFLIAFLGLVVGFAFVMSAIGSTSYLIMDGHYIFAAASLVVLCFAAKPIKDFFVKNTLM